MAAKNFRRKGSHALSPSNLHPLSPLVIPAEARERLVPLPAPSPIAAFITEPISGSAGVILPPHGYLQRIREICDRHGILLIFDEVITGFGRVGEPFAAQRFGVTPDLMTTAKGLTSGCVPMGAVFVSEEVHAAFMQGPEGAIELFHGYTYTGHPLACAAALATLDTYAEEGLLTRARELEQHWEDGLHALRTANPDIIDIRNFGLIGAVELAPQPGAPGARGYQVLEKAFRRGLLVRVTGDTVALSPPLIIQREQIDEIFSILGQVLSEV